MKGVDVATLGPGDYFGEVALIDGGPRMATVTAATALVCYGFTFWELRPLVERNPAIAWKLLQAPAKRLRASEDDLGDLRSPEAAYGDVREKMKRAAATSSFIFSGTSLTISSSRLLT